MAANGQNELEEIILPDVTDFKQRFLELFTCIYDNIIIQGKIMNKIQKDVEEINRDIAEIKHAPGNYTPFVGSRNRAVFGKKN